MSHDFFYANAFQHLLQSKLPLLKKSLAYHDNDTLENLMKGLHSSEMAYLIKYLDHPYRDLLITWMKPCFDPEIFLFLDDQLKEDVLSLLSVNEIAAITHVLESDDALALLASLSEEMQNAVLQILPEEKKTNFRRYLAYPRNSAGRLMQQEMLVLRNFWTVKESLEYITYTDYIPSHFYHAFVVDHEDRPVGMVPITTLVKSKKNACIMDIMEKELRIISCNLDQEQVALTFRMYDLMFAPVVSVYGILVGVITADDVIDVIERNATEDILFMGGVHTSDFYQTVRKTSLSRINWLFITLLNTLMTSMVIHFFQKTLEQAVSLTILMPIAAAMGGNAGMQSATIIIRALATRELTQTNLWRTTIKEAKVALMNGSIFGLFLGIVVFSWLNDVVFAFILAASVIFNMLWAGIMGVVLPVFIDRVGFDPALSAGPLLTTTTDVLGYIIFLGLAQLFM